jgi:transposase
MRFGLHTTHCRLWTGKTIRPEWKVKLSYHYGYLSVALNPMTGDLITAFLPDMSQESYQAFLDHIQSEITENILLIRDNAPSHMATTLRVPTMIELHELPPYSPELNPAERFFEELRPLLANRIFESLEALEDAITEILRKYWENPKLLQRLTAFPWIKKALGKQNTYQNSKN